MKITTQYLTMSAVEESGEDKGSTVYCWKEYTPENIEVYTTENIRAFLTKAENKKGKCAKAV